MKALWLTILLAILALWALSSCLVRSQTVTMAWDASPSAGVTNYRVYYSLTPTNFVTFTNAGTALRQAIKLPQNGRWYFIATAQDALGIESLPSNLAQFFSRPIRPTIATEGWVIITPLIGVSSNLVSWTVTNGEPVWIPATNRERYFRNSGIQIEYANAIK